MSLHDEILDIRGDTEDNSASYALGLCDAKQEAAALAIKADAEIASMAGEIAVLRDLLRDALPIIENVGDGDRRWSIAERLEPLINAAINGHAGGLFDGGGE